MSDNFLSTIAEPLTVTTPIDSTIRFPEILTILSKKYDGDIALFRSLVVVASSSGDLLDRIRQPSIPAPTRMSLLKIFRRCVSPILDTENTKKISSVSTASLVENYGVTFKQIDLLKLQFAEMDGTTLGALAALIGEYDNRGQLGYALTGLFFDWFEKRFEGEFTIEGPRGAGRDIELRTIFPDYQGDYPCDFVIRTYGEGEVLAIGFARYDSTRGGAQSDDRTGGNSYKVSKIKEYCAKSSDRLRVLFLADGPGLGHRDTWKAACDLDGDWDGNVRVTTLKLAEARVTADWLNNVASERR
jgi:hypothetical protein